MTTTLETKPADAQATGSADDKPDLKVADTGEEAGQESAAGDGDSPAPGTAADPSAPPAGDAKPKKRKRPSKAKGTERLSPEDMRKEINRVQKGKGQPVIAEGTHPEDEGKAKGSAKAPAPNPEPPKMEAERISDTQWLVRHRVNQSDETAEEHHARLTQAAREEYCRVSIALGEAKENVKLMKKECDVLLNRLYELEHDGPERLPLIDEAQRRSVASPSTASSADSSNGKAEDGQRSLDLHDESDSRTAGEAWRNIHVDNLIEFGSTAQISKALIESNRILGLGQLADFSNDNHGRLNKLKGIGKASAEKLTTALEKFWKHNTHLIPAGVEAGGAEVKQASDKKPDGKPDASKPAKKAAAAAEPASTTSVASKTKVVPASRRTQVGMAGRPARKSAKKKAAGGSKKKSKSRPRKPR